MYNKILTSFELIHSKIMLDYLLCAKNCPSYGGYDDGQNQPVPCFHGA